MLRSQGVTLLAGYIS